jgi:multicomponent K+:H+ antiporter subunit E
MSRLVPEPLLSFALATLWLLLNDSLGLGHWLIALGLGISVPLVTAPLRPQRGHLARPGTALRLLGAVAADVVASSLQLALGVLRARSRAPHSAFVAVPLDVRDADALAVLAIITTVVPGTVWFELAPDRSSVLLHVFDVDDDAAFIAHYKQRYEQALMEIFE